MDEVLIIERPIHFGMGVLIVLGGFAAGLWIDNERGWRNEMPRGQKA